MFAEERAGMVDLYVIEDMTMASTIVCEFGSHGIDFNTLVLGGCALVEKFRHAKSLKSRSGWIIL